LLKRVLTATAVATSLVLSLSATAEATVESSPADTPRTPQFDGFVRSVVHKGDTIYVAGDFSSVTSADAKQHARDGLAAVSASTGRVLRWAPTVNGHVHKVLAAKEGVYVVGDFTRVNRQRRIDVARLDRVTGAVDRRFRHRTDGEVNAVALSGSKVYLGGQFTRFDGTPRGQLAAVSRRGSSKLRGWAPQSGGGQINDLVRRKSGVYVAGAFHRLEGTNRSFLALVDGGEGNLVRSFAPRAQRLVLDIAVTRTRVYAAAGGRTGGRATSFKRTDGSVVFERRLDGDVQAITTLRGEVYLGGHFTSICRPRGAQDKNGLCEGGPQARRLRGASLASDGDLTGWNPQLNPENSSIPGIETFTTFKRAGRLFIGGEFTKAAGEDARRFAVYAEAS